MRTALRYAVALGLLGLSGCVIAIGNKAEVPLEGAFWEDFTEDSVVGSGKRATRLRQLAPFDRIVVAGAIDTVVRVGGEASSVELSGDDNLLEHVRTSVADGTLVLKFESGHYVQRRPLVATVATPALRAATLESSADLEVWDVEAEDFELDHSGSGLLAATGSARDLRVSSSGSGDLDADELLSVRADVTVSGSGDVYVQASETLAVQLSGSGDAVYRGDPTVQSTLRGSGELFQE